MLDLATPSEDDLAGTTVETNGEIVLSTPKWLGDTDFELVAFSPSGTTCEVVRACDLACDIASALLALDKAAGFADQKPDWY